MGKKASIADVEKAFTAGFEDKDFEIGAEASEEDIAADELAAKTTETLETIVEKAKPTETPAPEVDEWEGIPDVMRTRFEAMETNLKQATDIAKSASGRTNKLQSALDKQKNQIPVEKPKPTKDQILEALSNKEKRDELRVDWDVLASALDDMDQSVSNSVGSAIDNIRSELLEEARNINRESMRELEVKRNLDIKHPGWENTVNDADFKSWVYEGGPSEQERTHYESLLGQAGKAIPENSAAAFQQANEYYETLLDANPVWASQKGSLYGNSSGDAAVSLLDSFKLSKPRETETPPAEVLVNKNRQRLEDNIAPTRGNSLNIPQSDAADVEKAFEDGFTGSSY